MKKYTVKGMSCAVCAQKVENAVSKVDGVENCSVNLITGTLSVNGATVDETIIKAVQDAGYSVQLQTEPTQSAKKATEKLGFRLVLSCVTVLVLMYITMGVVMWGFPFVSAFKNPFALAVIQFILATAVMVINRKFFISGAKSILNGSPNMDALVSLGSGASLIYSVVITVIIAIEQFSGNIMTATVQLHGLYYESSAMILALITVGKTLESVAKGRTTNAITSLMSLAPSTATLIIDGKEKIVVVSQIAVGDETIVRAGGKFACDGVIISGECSVDESALTGESVPVDKTVGDTVSSATTIKSGYAIVKAQRVGEDTTLSEIVKTVENANASKARISRVADKISAIFVPIVFGIAIITTLAWFIGSGDIGFSLGRGISVIVISCPCALGLATPVAVMVGSGMGARCGVLYKSAQSLENAGRIKTVALDKTGTITLGKPVVTDVIAFDNENELTSVAYSLEKLSEHPLGVAIAEEFSDAKAVEIKDFTTLSGSGVSGMIEDQIVYGGNVKFICSVAIITDEQKRQSEKLQEQGKTVVAFSRGGKVLGLIALQDEIKQDAQFAVERFKEMGIETVIITGDSEIVAKAVAKKIGVERYFASVLPNGKAEILEKLKLNGKTAFVGDGINDAPALTVSDLGIAIGTGTEIAIDSAQVVLPSGNLMGVVNTLKIGQKTLKNIKQNLFWAFLYNCLAIPIACGALVPLGITLTPAIGALAMSLSSVCVVTNALRLNFYKEEKTKKIVEKAMEFTFKIEGMMCPHCEARVKTTIESIDGVTVADVNYKKGTAIVKAEKDVKVAVETAIKEQGYKVL